MYCVKNGASLYIEELGQIVAADIYQVGQDVLVVRWLPEQQKNSPFISEQGAREIGATHFVTTGPWPAEDWCRSELGVLVTQRYLLHGELCG